MITIPTKEYIDNKITDKYVGLQLPKETTTEYADTDIKNAKFAIVTVLLENNYRITITVIHAGSQRFFVGDVDCYCFADFDNGILKFMIGSGLIYVLRLDRITIVK
ncbi:hypothetical protein MKC73_20210 [[Clostridium] innocuum]|nr:hypothetical protein [[Clostridium] innocuum]